MKGLRGILVCIMVVSLLATATAAFAQGGERPEGGPGGFGGPSGGEVTAVTDSSITVVSPNGETTTAAVSADTRVFIVVTQNEGSLADVQVGTTVQIMGRPDDSGTVTADGIMVVPAGDVMRGEITGADDTTLVLEDNMPMRPPQDSQNEGTPVAEATAVVNTVVIDDGTQFFVSGTEGSIEDATVGMFASAYGTTQADGSLLATVVIVSDAQQGPGGMGMEGGGPGGPGGGPGGPGGAPGGPGGAGAGGPGSGTSQ